MLINHRLAARAIHAVWRRVEFWGSVAPGTDKADEFAGFGRGSMITFPYAALFGCAEIHLGADTLIGRHCSLSVGYGDDDPSLPHRGLVIGDRCVIGQRATITAHESIEIGDDVWFGQDVFVSDSGHGYQDPDTPIGVQWGERSPVVIGAGSWVGHGAILLPGTRLGRNTVVAAGSVVRGEFPDHAVVGGVPAKVLRTLEPGLGWVPASGTGEVRPIWRHEDVERLLSGEG